MKHGVPNDFQIIVKPLLKSIYDTTLKLHRIIESITRSEKHGNENTFPPQIVGAIKQPKFQFNKNLDSAAGNIPPEKRTTNTVAISLSSNVQSLRYSYRELLLRSAFLANGDYTRSLVKKLYKAENKQKIELSRIKYKKSEDIVLYKILLEI